MNNVIVKQTVYDKLVTRLNNIDTSGFVLKTKYDTDNQIQKMKLVIQTKKFLILVDLLKSHNIILGLLKQQVKHLILMI